MGGRSLSRSRKGTSEAGFGVNVAQPEKARKSPTRKGRIGLEHINLARSNTPDIRIFLFT